MDTSVKETLVPVKPHIYLCDQRDAPEEEFEEQEHESGGGSGTPLAAADRHGSDRHGRSQTTGHGPLDSHTTQMRRPQDHDEEGDEERRGT